MTISNKTKSIFTALCFVMGTNFAHYPTESFWKYAPMIVLYVVGWFLIDPLIKKADFIDNHENAHREVK